MRHSPWRVCVVALVLVACGRGANDLRPQTTRIFRGRPVRGAIVLPAAYEEYLRGALALEREDATAAAGHFRAAIASDDRSPFLLSWLARAELRRGDLAAAERAVAAALRVEPRLELAWIVRGELQETRGDLEAARDAFQTAVEVEPGEEDPSLDYGAFLERSGQRGRAAREYERLLARAPRAVRVRRALGLVLLDLGQVEEGVAELERVVRGSGGEREALLRLAAAQLASADPSRAAELYRAAMAAEDRAQSGRRGLIEALLALRARGDAAEQIRLYRPVGEPVGVALERAELLLRADEHDLAAAEADLALGARPDLHEARLVLGLAHEGAGRRDVAMRTLAAVPPTAAVFGGARVAMARVLRRIGEPGGARAILEDALLLSPGADEVRVALARLALESNDRAGAQAALAGGRGPAAQAELALLWLAQGRRSAALERLRRLARRFPLEPAAVLPLARLEIDDADTESALGRLERLLRARPAEARALALVALAYSRADRAESARHLAARALRADPVDPEVVALVAEVDERRGARSAALAGYRRALRFGPDRALRSRLEARIRRVAGGRR